VERTLDLCGPLGPEEREQEMDEGTDAGQVRSEAPRDAVDRIEHALGDWRGQVDGLLVQLNLASMDLREEFAKQLGVVQNAGLAVRPGLEKMRDDLTAGLMAPRDTVGEVLHDLQRAIDAAKKVVERREAS
jgi:hypothetical protein